MIAAFTPYVKGLLLFIFVLCVVGFCAFAAWDVITYCRQSKKAATALEAKALSDDLHSLKENLSKLRAIQRNITEKVGKGLPNKDLDSELKEAKKRDTELAPIRQRIREPKDTIAIGKLYTTVESYLESVESTDDALLNLLTHPSTDTSNAFISSDLKEYKTRGELNAVIHSIYEENDIEEGGA